MAMILYLNLISCCNPYIKDDVLVFVSKLSSNMNLEIRFLINFSKFTNEKDISRK